MGYPFPLRHLMVDPFQAGFDQGRNHSRGGKVVPGHEGDGVVSRGYARHCPGRSGTGDGPVNHGVDGDGAAAEQGEEVFSVVDLGYAAVKVPDLRKKSRHDSPANPGDKSVTIHGSPPTTPRRTAPPAPVSPASGSIPCLAREATGSIGSGPGDEP